MRAVAARVTTAHVTVADTIVGAIDRPGLLVLLGIHHDDSVDAARTMARKLYELRILRDEKSCAISGAPILLVSQFTLYGDTRKGRRPSWGQAAPSHVAHKLVDSVTTELITLGADVSTGTFGAEMQIHSVNDGPFTVLIEI